MTTQRKFEIAGAVVAVLAIVFLVRFDREEHAANARAEARSAADQKTIDANQQAIAQRDKQAAQYQAHLATAAAAVQTAPQAAQIITRYLPAPTGTATTPVVTVARQDLPAAVQAEIPDAPGPVVVLSQQQAVDVARNDLTCDATQMTLQACTADKADLQKSLAASQDSANAWKTAAKQGTKWQRLGRVAKCIGETGAGAYVASKLSHSPAAPAIGAAAGTVTCTLF